MLFRSIDPSVGLAAPDTAANAIDPSVGLAAPDTAEDHCPLLSSSAKEAAKAAAVTPANAAANVVTG